LIILGRLRLLPTSSILLSICISNIVVFRYKNYKIIEIFVPSPGTIMNGNLGYLSTWIDCGYNNEDG
jgi:hypothetical protein